jgi:hypothetical protein
VSPKNVNIVVRIDSPGDDGPVTQTNSSVANATGSNANDVVQAADQTQLGGAPRSGQAQQTTQTAPTTQESSANAASTQVNPMNVNIVVRNKSPGDEAPVSQTNSSQASAVATNANAVDQGATQAQTGGASQAGQAQSLTQAAPTTQSASGDVVVSVDPAAPDPNGSGGLGSLIQVWIPTQSSTATGTNANSVNQSADQVQTAPADDSTQSGGSAQTQIVSQNAPTAQVATASTAGETAESSSATAVAVNASDISQTADQTQVGGSGGSQVQVIVQTAPTNEPSAAIAVATGGWTESIEVQTSSTHVSQEASQTQAGGGTQVQIVEQTTVGVAVASAPKRAPTVSSGFVSATAAALWTAPEASSDPPAHMRASQDRRTAAPQSPKKLPLPPQAPSSAGAAGGSGGGGSLWAFAGLLIPFLLTALWWARRHRPSAVRRLMGVVSRLERPG